MGTFLYVKRHDWFEIYNIIRSLIFVLASLIGPYLILSPSLVGLQSITLTIAIADCSTIVISDWSVTLTQTVADWSVTLTHTVADWSSNPYCHYRRR